MINIAKLVKAPKNKKDLHYIKRKYYNGVISLMNVYNSFATLLRSRKIKHSGYRELDEIRQRSFLKTDICDHLETLFIESLSVKPKLIMELGVGPGESTFVLERVAKIYNAKLISVDMKEEPAKVSSWKDWIFVNSDDIKFAKNFKNWAKEKNIENQIDILFIDTSHEYDHTTQEIEHWFPFLSDGAKVFFHDTNAKPIYRRRDGSIGLAPDINRGVISAIENYFNTSFNEKKSFVDFRNGWLIKHYSICNGFTILEKVN